MTILACIFIGYVLVDLVWKIGREKEITELQQRIRDLETRRPAPLPLPTETISKIGGNTFIHHHVRR